MNSPKRRAALVVFTTTALAVALLAAFPGLAHETETGPLAPVIFTGAWTNDDGVVNDGDTGDNGLPSAGFDIWPANDSSDDPETVGVLPIRRPDDAGRCIAAIRQGSPGHVDLTIDNGYPQYVCTVTLEVTNGASIPAAVEPAVIEADHGLEVVQITDHRGLGVIGPGDSAELVFSIRILNESPQDSVRGLTITTLVINPGRILFWRHLAGAGEIGVMDFDGTGEVIFWESPLNYPDTQPAWSPDGSLIAFVRGGAAGARDVYVMPSTGSGPRSLVTLDGRHPDWSPDSTQIVFHASRIHPARTEIYTIPVGGGSPSLVHRDGDQADWSPDGSQIAFRHITTDLKQIWVVNADGTDPVNISNSAFTDEWPDWSPDGSQIVFTRNVPSSGSREVFVMNSDGSGSTQLTFIGGVTEKPHWSPDGSRILFSRFGEIWLMDADGSNVAHVGSGGDPSWEQFGP